MKQYIVLDLEWNQCASGKEHSVPEIPFEIIEIGAVKLDENFNIIDEFKQIVKPTVYKKLHFIVMDVVHIGIDELRRQGVPFKTACKSFFDWCDKGADGDKPIFCTWGNMDITELERNMVYHKIPLSFHYPMLYYDVQKLYGFIQVGDMKRRMPLDKAVKDMGLFDEKRPFHRALDDAYYTALVMQRLDMSAVKEYMSLDYYRLPESADEEVYLVYPDYSKYVSKLYKTKEAAIADKAVTDMLCYRCKRLLRKKIRWFTSNQKIYHCLAYCPEHGFVKGKIRMKKDDKDRVYAVKTIKLVDENEAQKVASKRDEAVSKRSERNRRKRLKDKHA